CWSQKSVMGLPFTVQSELHILASRVEMRLQSRRVDQVCRSQIRNVRPFGQSGSEQPASKDILSLLAVFFLELKGGVDSDDYVHGRLADHRVPDDWERSKKDNLTCKLRRGRVTIFLHPHTSPHAGMYGIVWIRSGVGSEPVFLGDRWETEEDALWYAKQLIEEEMLE